MRKSAHNRRDSRFYFQTQLLHHSCCRLPLYTCAHRDKGFLPLFRKSLSKYSGVLDFTILKSSVSGGRIFSSNALTFSTALLELLTASAAILPASNPLTCSRTLPAIAKKSLPTRVILHSESGTAKVLDLRTNKLSAPTTISLGDLWMTIVVPDVKISGW